MTDKQVQAIQTALQTAHNTIQAQGVGDFIVGAAFPPNATAPTPGHSYPTAMAFGNGQYAKATLRVIPSDVEVVQLLPLEHRKEDQK